MSTRIPGGPLKKCDIVMKGGITSGIVYPGLICKLSERYQFQSIGGTSAGAIAAALTAAAEYARRKGRDAFKDLGEVPGWLGAPSAELQFFVPVILLTVMTITPSMPQDTVDVWGLQSRDRYLTFRVRRSSLYLIFIAVTATPSASSYETHGSLFRFLSGARRRVWLALLHAES